MRKVNPVFTLVVSIIGTFAVLLAMSIVMNIIAGVKITKLEQEVAKAHQEAQVAQSMAKQVSAMTGVDKATETVPTDNGEELTVVATAYCGCVECCGEWSKEHPSRAEDEDFEQLTASGTVPKQGRTIAVDPDVIPLGSTVLLNGHTYIAEDTGGAIQGDRIDIYFEDHEEALEWGRQTVEVLVYEK